MIKKKKIFFLFGGSMVNKCLYISKFNNFIFYNFPGLLIFLSIYPKYPIVGTAQGIG